MNFVVCKLYLRKAITLRSSKESIHPPLFLGILSSTFQSSEYQVYFIGFQTFWAPQEHI